MLEYFSRVQKHFSFDKQEMKELMALSLVFTFTLGYGRLLSAESSFMALNIILSSFAIAVSAVFTKEIGHKLMAIKRGYTVKVKLWYPMLLISLILTFLLDGQIYIILPATGLLIYHHERMRIGEFQYGHNYLDNAVIAFFGPVANIYLALFFRIFSTLQNPNVMVAMEFNIIYAIMGMIPLDIILFFLKTDEQLEKADSKEHPAPVSGTYILYSTKLFYVSCATALGVLAASIYVSGPLISTVSAFLVGVVVYFMMWWWNDFAIV